MVEISLSFDRYKTISLQTIIQVQKKTISSCIDSMSIDSFLGKCLSLVTGPEFVDVNTTEEVIENTKHDNVANR